MKHAVYFLILIACGAPPDPVTPVPTTPACPACPACLACPPSAAAPVLDDCAACVQLPARIVGDWHCLDVRLASGLATSFCYPTATVCEHKRERLIAQGGTSSACTTHREVYCTEVSDAKTISRPLMCASTLAYCELRRTDILENEPVSDDATACKRRYNTDTFERNRPDAD